MRPILTRPTIQLYEGDAREAASVLPTDSVRLVYLDPPFFSSRTFKARSGNGGFRDCWNGDPTAYLDFISALVKNAIHALQQNGALLIHLDWHIVHHVKVRLDHDLGMRHFVQEIIWSYNSGGGTKNRYGRKHDTILWYAPRGAPYFDAEAARVPYSASIARSRRHLFNQRGKVSGDVIHIRRPPNHSPEWTGWPTQKPAALLRFLIRCHSAPNDIIADLCCGSGTTLAAALEEKRRAFGVDQSPDAIWIAHRRLLPYLQDAESTTPPSKEP